MWIYLGGAGQKEKSQKIKVELSPLYAGREEGGGMIIQKKKKEEDGNASAQNGVLIVALEQPVAAQRQIGSRLKHGDSFIGFPGS